MRLQFDRGDGGIRLLALGAHADDIEIGAGATILRLASEGMLASVRWVVLGATNERAEEARHGAAAFLEGVEDTEVLVEGFRDGFFPYVGGAVKDFFEAHKQSFEPDLILAPRREDLHQDHRLVAELTWNTYRGHLILEYEVPKYDGDLGAPNLFVEVSEALCERKIDLLQSTFRTQLDRHWFDPAVYWAVLRLRGVESCSATRFAEGFTCRKAVL